MRWQVLAEPWTMTMDGHDAGTRFKKILIIHTEMAINLYSLLTHTGK